MGMSGVYPTKSISPVNQNDSRRSYPETRSLATINLRVPAHTNCIKDVRRLSGSEDSSWQPMRHICAIHCKQ